MNIFRRWMKTLRMVLVRRRQARAEREAFQLILARGDDHLLRDIGLTLHEAKSIDPSRLGKGRCDTGNGRRD
jgi:uncharacterized protein YjiS (DUF1127 family)